LVLDRGTSIHFFICSENWGGKKTKKGNLEKEMFVKGGEGVVLEVPILNRVSGCVKGGGSYECRGEVLQVMATIQR